MTVSSTQWVRLCFQRYMGNVGACSCLPCPFTWSFALGAAQMGACDRRAVTSCMQLPYVAVLVLTACSYTGSSVTGLGEGQLHVWCRTLSGHHGCWAAGWATCMYRLLAPCLTPRQWQRYHCVVLPVEYGQAHVPECGDRSTYTCPNTTQG